MSSASKTLELLDFFDPQHPEIGLSQMCRLVGSDKATTHRRLQSLIEAGLLEQNPITKRYRLGPALLQLAQTREQTVPREAGAAGPLRELADATGETSHVSVLSGKVLYQLAAVESPRHSIRVIMDTRTFPLHATSSGLCALAFGSADLIDRAGAKLTRYTPNTITQIDALQASIERVRNTGFGTANGSFELGVCSVGAPVFDQTGLFAGAVSTASVATRFTPELQSTIKSHLVSASRKITHNWGGTVPANIEHAWAHALAQTPDQETTQ